VAERIAEYTFGATRAGGATVEVDPKIQNGA